MIDYKEFLVTASGMIAVIWIIWYFFFPKKELS